MQEFAGGVAVIPGPGYPVLGVGVAEGVGRTDDYLGVGVFQFVAEQVVARCARALLRETFYPGVVSPDPEIADGRIHFLHFAGKFPVLEYLDFPFAAHAREKYVGKYDVAAHPVGIRGSFAAENVVPGAGSRGCAPYL